MPGGDPAWLDIGNRQLLVQYANVRVSKREVTIYTRKLGSKAAAELHVMDGKVEALRIASNGLVTVLYQDALTDLAEVLMQATNGGFSEAHEENEKREAA